jgi:hypothetical protein
MWLAPLGSPWRRACGDGRDSREYRRMRSNGRTLAGDLARGALAGAAATWVMNRVTTYMYEHEDREVRRREDEARGNKDAYVTAAEKAADLLGTELNGKGGRAGTAIHWALGVGIGALYGALRGRVPRVDSGQGSAFGTAFWLLVDEGANPALGLTPGPTAFPWQAHARGLAGHLAYGVTAETALDLAERIGG